LGEQPPVHKSVKNLQWRGPNNSGERKENPLTQRGYLIGLSIIFASAYSQYLVIGFGTLFALLIVYGVPISVASFLFGSVILRRAFNHTSTALKWGMGLFGISSLGGILGASAIFSVIVVFDPKASYLLHKPNPLLQVPPEYAWIMVWLSLVLVGPAEEYVFRGFVYGGLLSLSKNRHWLSLAFFASLLFALAHLYYALVYGIASLAPFVELLAIGMGLAATYYLSGGNLLIPSILHGLYDATGFLTVALSPEIGLLLRLAMISAGIIVAFGLLVRMMLSRPSRQ
jgi:membrane protease YdiL (CAAX protease family)